MRVPVYQSSDFAYFASLTPVHHPEEHYQLLISSTFANAINPEQEQVSLRLTLDRFGIQQLRNLLAAADTTEFSESGKP